MRKPLEATAGSALPRQLTRTIPGRTSRATRWAVGGADVADPDRAAKPVLGGLGKQDGFFFTVER